MRSLVINEFRHMRAFILILFGVVVIAALLCAVVDNPDLSLAQLLRLQIVMMPVYLGMSVPTYSFRGEERGDTWRFLRALPAGGGVVVSAKFAASLLALAGGLVLAIAGLAVADGHGRFGVAFATMALPAAAGVLLLAVNFWLRFWVGNRNATSAWIILVVALQVLGVVTLAIGGGGFSFFSVIDVIVAWGRTAAAPPTLAIVAVTTLLACWQASIRIYDRRDMTKSM
jgi:hypothetical protein